MTSRHRCVKVKSRWLTRRHVRVAGTPSSGMSRTQGSMPVNTTVFQPRNVFFLGHRCALSMSHADASLIFAKADPTLIARPLAVQFDRNRLAPVRVGVIPIPSSTAPTDVPLKMLSYCSIFNRELYGWRRMRRKVPPVTSSHAPKRASYLYFDNGCSMVWSAMLME